MLSLTKICILIAILLVAMEGKGANVKTPNEDQDIQMMEEEKEATGDSIEENIKDEEEPVGTIYDAESCSELWKKYNVSTGKYNLRINGSIAKNVQCYMMKFCNIMDGWTSMGLMRAFNGCRPSFILNENHSNECTRKKSAPGCAGITFPSHRIEYTTICGIVLGYQKGRTGGFYKNKSINEAYLDGVSITRFVDGERVHVYSFAAGRDEQRNIQRCCPCKARPRGIYVPSFVGNNYICESGSSDKPSRHKTYRNDFLWDEWGIHYREAACQPPRLSPFHDPPGLPYGHFLVSVPATTSDLELRLCGNIPKSKGAALLIFYNIVVR